MIASATSADAEVLACIHAASFPDPWDGAVIAAFLRSPEVAGFVADAPPTGFLLCRRIADEAEILTLAVTPDFRRQGVGAALLEYAARWSRDAGARALFLEVASDNATALALYHAAGFRKVGCRRAYYSRPSGAMDARVLRLDLAARP